MPTPSKKILIITYYWPPGSGPGVQRFLKMSRYLLELGWEPIVLTVKNGSYPSRDESLLEEIPSEITVYRTKTFEPFTLYNKLTGGKGNESTVGLIGIQNDKSLIKKISLFIRANFFLPDARKGWNRFAYKKAKEIVKKHQPGLVITTGPPHSTHLIGKKLKNHFSLRWVADMRDPWTNMYFNKLLPKTQLTKMIDQKTEDKIIRSADGITAVSPGLKEEFSDRAKKTAVIYNGFDPEDLPEPQKIKTNVFTLSYIGNFKPNQNIQSVWEAISELKEVIDGFEDHFRISLTGNIDQGVLSSLEQLQLKNITSIQPFVPHKEATKIMNSSNLLLFIVPMADSNKLIITGKLFEYLAVRSPILSIGPTDGDASTLLKEAGRDSMQEYENITGIKNILSQYYNKWIEDEKLSFKHKDTSKKDFSRFSMAEKLSNFLKEVI